MFEFLKNLWKSEKTYDFYLAGGMRGYKDLNKPMFTLVAHLLREKGYTVWSPSEHDSYLKLSFAQCMTADLNAVVHLCKGIVLLPGWRDSLGANMEAFSAFACCKNSVEVILNDNHTDIELTHIDLSGYRLPYKIGDSRQFDPHKCEIDSFNEK